MTLIGKTALAAGTIAIIVAAAATPSQAYDPAYAYTGDPAYRGYAYGPGYGAYAYSPGYGYAPGYGAYAYSPGYAYGPRYDGRYRSTPRHYDPGAGYNSNTVAPWQDWKNQGHDY